MKKTFAEYEWKKEGSMHFLVSPDKVRCTDIEVDSNSDTAIFKHKMIMISDTKKSFPNVTKLIIEQNVCSIDIPNSLFPNVNEIESDSSYFLSGTNVLIEQNIFSYTLINAFHKKESDEICLDNVDCIEDYAFSGCEEVKLVLKERASNTVIDCTASSFKDSAFESNPYNNGLKLAGPLIIDVDNTAEEVVLPKEELIGISNAANKMRSVKKLRVKNLRTFINLRIRATSIIIDKECHIYNNKEMLSFFSALEPDVNVVSENEACNIVDDIVYSKNMSFLIYCLPYTYREKKEVDIPEGVRYIGYGAFSRCMNIDNVNIPDSVKNIGPRAFMNSSVKSVKFGTGITDIAEDTFSYCPYLSHIDIPSNVKHIRTNAFSYCESLSSVNFSEGLVSIEYNAFGGHSFKNITLPDSLEDISRRAFFTRNDSKITVKSRHIPKGFVRAFTVQKEANYMFTDECIELITDDFDMPIFIPRIIDKFIQNRYENILQKKPINMSELMLLIKSTFFCDSLNLEQLTYVYLRTYKYYKDKKMAEALNTDEVMSIILNSSEDMFIDLISLDCIDIKYPKDILNVLKHKHWTIGIAYLLDKIQPCADDSFSL